MHIDSPCLALLVLLACAVPFGARAQTARLDDQTVSITVVSAASVVHWDRNVRDPVVGTETHIEVEKIPDPDIQGATATTMTLMY
jgi:hypothetical protein